MYKYVNLLHVDGGEDVRLAELCGRVQLLTALFFIENCMKMEVIKMNYSVKSSLIVEWQTGRAIFGFC